MNVIMKIISKELIFYSTDFTIEFLENGNRYKVEIIRANLFFIGLSNDISHFVVDQNFIISTFLRYVDILY